VFPELHPTLQSIRDRCEEHLRDARTTSAQWAVLIDDAGAAIGNQPSLSDCRIGQHLANALQASRSTPVNVPVLVHELEFALLRAEWAVAKAMSRGHPKRF
jgi:hypothetical protein